MLGGVQYELTNVRLGATLRTPGVTLKRDGVVTLDGILEAGASSLGASVFDPAATFEYRLPWEFQGGGAYVRERGQVEIEIQTFGSISPYALLATDHQTAIYGDTGPNMAPAIITRPFAGLTSASDAVVNVAVGGQFKVMQDRPFRIHAGYSTDNSPVAADDQVFHHVDMQSWTLGVSGAVGKLQFAVGFNHSSGTADALIVRNVLRTDPVRTAVDISTTGLIYSLSYQF
jgi:hypothetical protein